MDIAYIENVRAMRHRWKGASDVGVLSELQKSVADSKYRTIW